MQAIAKGNLNSAEPCPGLVPTVKLLKRKKMPQPVHILASNDPDQPDIWVMEETKQERDNTYLSSDAAA